MKSAATTPSPCDECNGGGELELACEERDRLRDRVKSLEDRLAAIGGIAAGAATGLAAHALAVASVSGVVA